jgi:single-strand DNA-binding protein
MVESVHRSATEQATAVVPGDHPHGMEASQQWVNEVRLVGRLSADPQERELPSGDQVVQLRVVVPREPGSGGGGGAGRVDTIDVACWSARTRRTSGRLHRGDVVEVAGVLRRRFFRAGAATVSRYEVEAGRVARRRGLVRTL